MPDRACGAPRPRSSAATTAFAAARSKYRRGGRAVQTEGDCSEADSAALNAPAANVLVMYLAKSGRASVRTYVISPHGREMTQSAANVDNTGAPFVRSFHFGGFSRLPDGRPARWRCSATATCCSGVAGSRRRLRPGSLWWCRGWAGRAIASAGLQSCAENGGNTPYRTTRS
jgi:hypothetical protein